MTINVKKCCQILKGNLFKHLSCEFDWKGALFYYQGYFSDNFLRKNMLFNMDQVWGNRLISRSTVIRGNIPLVTFRKIPGNGG